MKIQADELYDTINNSFKKTKKDDSFDFCCMRCGKCCKFYKNIILTPSDIFKASKYLSLPPRDFIGRYCNIRQDFSSKLPYVKFSEPNSGDNICHFYKEGKCSIHKAKPASCALYPAGRIFDPESGGLTYFIQPPECGEAQAPEQSKPAVSLLDWLDLHGIAGEEKFTVKWHEWLLNTAGKAAAILSDDIKYPAEAKDTFYSFLCVMIYFKYDTNSDFMPQFVQNCEETDGVTEMLLMA